MLPTLFGVPQVSEQVLKVVLVATESVFWSFQLRDENPVRALVMDELHHPSANDGAAGMITSPAISVVTSESFPLNFMIYPVFSSCSPHRTSRNYKRCAVKSQIRGILNQLS